MIDPVWIAAIAGPLVGTAAILVSILIYRASRERRRLSYEIFATPELLSVSPEIREEVKVTYQGKSVTNLEGVTVTITNSGNRSAQTPLKSAYEAPVTLTFGNKAEIIGEPRIIETIPEDLRVSARIDDGEVVVDPVLLNPGQRFAFFVLLSGSKGSARITAHIKDVELVEASAAPRTSPIRMVSVVLLLLLSGMVYLTSIVVSLANGLANETGEKTVFGEIVGMGLLWVSMAFLFLGVLIVFRVDRILFGRSFANWLDDASERGRSLRRRR